MAETKSKSTSSSKTSSSSSKSTTKTKRTRAVWGLNKISFWTIGAMAILYLVASILALCGVNLKIVQALQGFATAIAICIVAYLAWKYVRSKQTVWKVLYFVLLLVLLIAIIIPLVK